MDETLDISLLRTFVAIRDQGGFGRAAAVLQRSQPTVSQHVRALERRLGRRLVEKDGRGAKFTAAGERLLVEARRIVAVHDDALARLGLGAEEPLGAGPADAAVEPGTADHGAAAMTGFLRYVAARAPQLYADWETDREPGGAG